MASEKSSGIIAQLALPSQRLQNRPLRRKTKALTEEEKEKKKEQINCVLQTLFYNELRVCPDEGSLLLTEHIFTDTKTRAEMASLLFDEFETKALKSSSFQILWDELFFNYHVGRCPDEYRFLLTEYVLTSREEREMIIRLFFEDYKIMALMFVPQEFLALVANGREDGIVINMGHTYTSIVPIWKLNILRDKAVVLPVGGQDVTKALELYLKHQRAKQVYSIHDFDQLVVEQIKESKAYVALNYEVEMRKPEELVEFELPDSQIVKLGRELFKCTECYFKPEIFGIKDTQGLVESVNGLIDTLEEGIKRDLADQSASLFLTGSSSMFPGLVERLQKHFSMRVRATSERKLSSWIGGSIWAELSQNKNSWTTKEEYDEFGPSVVHSKCI